MRHLTSCTVSVVRSIIEYIRLVSNNFHLENYGARGAPLTFSGRAYRWSWMQAKKIY